MKFLKFILITDTLNTASNVLTDDIQLVEKNRLRLNGCQPGIRVETSVVIVMNESDYPFRMLNHDSGYKVIRLGGGVVISR